MLRKRAGVGWSFVPVLLVALVASSFGPVPASAADVLWTGNQIDDWYSTANSGQAYSSDVNHPLLGAAVRLVNENVDGSHSPGARLNFQGFGSDRVQPTEAWYAATFLVPYYIDGQDNAFQFKQGDGSTRRHIWNLGWKPVDGELRFVVRTRLDGATWNSTPREIATLDAAVPIGQPFRVEVFRRISTGSDGRFEVRIDGRTVWQFDGPTAAANLDPRPAGNHEWVLSHYLGMWQGTVSPSTSETFVTDARVTTAPGTGGVAPLAGSFDGRFYDDDGSPHEQAIETLADSGILQGCNPPQNDRICLDRSVTRAEFAAMVVRTFDGGTSSRSYFPDVPTGAWYTGVVSRAYELGFVAGHTDGTFRPHALVSRAESAAMIVRAAGLATVTPTGRFVDVSSGDWFSGHVESLYTNSYVKGCATDPLRFCPFAALTRGEAASILEPARP